MDIHDWIIDIHVRIMDIYDILIIVSCIYQHLFVNAFSLFTSLSTLSMLTKVFVVKNIA